MFRRKPSNLPIVVNKKQPPIGDVKVFDEEIKAIEKEIFADQSKGYKNAYQDEEEDKVEDNDNTVVSNSFFTPKPVFNETLSGFFGAQATTNEPHNKHSITSPKPQSAMP